MDRRELNAAAMRRTAKKHARRFDGLHDYTQIVLREVRMRAEMGFDTVMVTILDHGERRILKELKDLGYKYERFLYAAGGYKFRISWSLKDDSGN